jgi:hypothetical protein
MIPKSDIEFISPRLRRWGNNTSRRRVRVAPPAFRWGRFPRASWGVPGVCGGPRKAGYEIAKI